MFTHTDIGEKENSHGNGPQKEYTNQFDAQYNGEDTFAAMYIHRTHKTYIKRKWLWKWTSNRIYRSFFDYN